MAGTEKKVEDAQSIVKKATADLEKARAKINRNIEALTRTEEAIQQLVREQVDLPTEIQISALVPIPSGTVITVDKNELDCVLMGMAKGQIVSRDEAFVLVIKKRVKSLAK